MSPQPQFCHNPRCWAYGRPNEGHVVIHSRVDRRYQCIRCRRTFSATAGTALYRLRTPPATVLTVLTLLTHGCSSGGGGIVGIAVEGRPGQPGHPNRPPHASGGTQR